MITAQQVGNEPPSPEIQKAAARVQEVMQERASEDVLKAVTGDDTLAVISLVNALKDRGSIDKNWPEVNLRVPEIPMGAPEGYKVSVAPNDFATAVLLTALRISTGDDGEIEYLPDSADEIKFGLWHTAPGVMWTWEFDQKRLRALIGPAYEKASAMIEDLVDIRTGISNDPEIAVSSLYASLWRSLGENVDKATMERITKGVERFSGAPFELLQRVSLDARLSALNGLLARTPAYRVSRVVGHVYVKDEAGEKQPDTFFACVLHGLQEVEDNPSAIRDAVLEVIKKAKPTVVEDTLLLISDGTNAFSIYDQEPQWDRIPVSGWHHTPEAKEIIEGWDRVITDTMDDDQDELADELAEEPPGLPSVKNESEMGSPGLQQTPPPSADEKEG